MKNRVVFFFGLFLLGELSAQTPVGGNAVGSSGFMVNTISGEVFTPIKFSNLVEGSPYYSEDWLRANITMPDGLEFNDVLIKLDLMESKVHYKDKNGQEMIASTLIKQIAFNEKNTGTTPIFIHSSFIGSAASQPANQWLMLLENGHIGLYKLLYKTMSENQPYNSATIEQTIKTSNRYFVSKDGKVLPVKNWTELTQLLNDRKSEIDNYLGTHKLKGKSEGDYRELVKFYNALKS